MNSKLAAFQAYLGYSETLEACLCGGDIGWESPERVQMEEEKTRLWNAYQRIPDQSCPTPTPPAMA